MSDLRAMQRLCGLMRKAVQDYEMIAPGDRVMVGVSGGKDSVALTIGLSMLRKYIGFDYEVVAVTLDPQFGGRPMDYTVLQELFAQYDIPYEIRRRVGFDCNDILSFEESEDGRSIVVRREKICDGCRQKAAAPENKEALLGFLDALTDEECRTALVHLSVKWAEKHEGSKTYPQE